MGIYDRDYNRADSYRDGPGFRIEAPRTITTKIVIFSVLVYLAQIFSDDRLTGVFELHYDWFRRPWQAYQLLTYGFLHVDPFHILFNMIALWFFGRDIEEQYGRREFLAFYLVAIVTSGLVWSLSEIPFSAHLPVVGASGGVTAVLILFAFNFPHRRGLFMFLFEMPMWAMAVLVVFIDAYGAIQRFGNVAFVAHLGGALFAAIYYKSSIRLTSWLPDRLWLKRLRARPRLRVHRPEANGDTDNQVDEILKKIQEHGQASLTRRERRILERASREYQRRRK
jgi:membrane associated rhomboid family serine protease